MGQTARPTRHQQKEQTRSTLIARAEELFAVHGIAATATADIAKAAKVSHGALFVHFPTREDLILAVVERFGDRLGAELGRRFVDDMKLRPLLKAHIAVLAEFEDFYVRLMCESQSLPPKIRSIVFSMNASLSYRFFRAAQSHMKDGTIKRFDQANFFNAWIALVNYYVMNRAIFADRLPILVERGDDVVRQFFHLIST